MKSMQFVLGAAAMLAGQLVFAHAELVASSPADGAALDTAPKELTLSFSEPVRLTAVAVQKAGEAKRSLGPLPSDTGTAFTVDAPAIADGQYTLTWRALSEDTHVMSGELVFAVGAGQMPPAHAQGQMGQHADGHMDDHMDDHMGDHMGSSAEDAHMGHAEAH